VGGCCWGRAITDMRKVFLFHLHRKLSVGGVGKKKIGEKEGKGFWEVPETGKGVQTGRGGSQGNRTVRT